LKLKKKKNDIAQAKLSLSDNRRELVRFWQQACVLLEKLELVFPLNDDRLRDLDENMWRERAKELMAVDFMVQEKLSRETLDLIMSMPAYQRRLLIDLTKDVPGLIEWYQTFDHGHFFQELSYQKPILKKQVKELLS